MARRYLWELAKYFLSAYSLRAIVAPLTKHRSAQHRTTMTRNQFTALCLAYGIAPCIALENENVRSALAARDAEAVEFALANEF